MGTVWFLASSAQTSEELALRAIIGGSICIVAILVLHAFTRNSLKATYMYFICILVCAGIVSFILLAGAIQSIVTAGAQL